MLSIVFSVLSIGEDVFSTVWSWFPSQVLVDRFWKILFLSAQFGSQSALSGMQCLIVWTVVFQKQEVCVLQLYSFSRLLWQFGLFEVPYNFVHGGKWEKATWIVIGITWNLYITLGNECINIITGLSMLILYPDTLLIFFSFVCFVI